MWPSSGRRVRESRRFSTCSGADPRNRGAGPDRRGRFCQPERRSTDKAAEAPDRLCFPEIQPTSHLSAIGNIEIAYDISGRKEPLGRAYLDHLSDLLSIRGRLKHRPSELSGGEQQRVAIARALITRPAIVLADEPTGNLDTKNSDAVLHMLLRSNRELGQTTLMITHNPEAAAIAGRILYMRDGEIVREEKGSGLSTRPHGLKPRHGRQPRRFDRISAARYTQSCNKRE